MNTCKSFFVKVASTNKKLCKGFPDPEAWFFSWHRYHACIAYLSVCIYEDMKFTRDLFVSNINLHFLDVTMYP